jgi:hypothetical protein
MTDLGSPLPDPGPGHNPPMYREPDAASGVPGGVILGVAVAAIVAAGAIWYSMSGPTTEATNPPTTTIGQGSPRVEAPVIPPVIKAVTPEAPAPQVAPPMPTPEPTPPINTAPNP